MARWNKMKAARRVEKDAAAGVERERVQQLEAARLYRRCGIRERVEGDGRGLRGTGER